MSLVTDTWLLEISILRWYFFLLFPGIILHYLTKLEMAVDVI